MTDSTTGLRASLRRIGAMVLRYLYLVRSSWPRILELAYWPTVQMIMWGLITQFFITHSDWVAQAAGVLIAAVLLWDVMFRSQLGVSLVFFEELYSRNLGHLFASPLRVQELLCALMLISLIRTAIGLSAAVLLAIMLFHYSIFSMGLPLVAFFINLLVMGWSIGLMVSGMVLRFGLGAESLAWVAIFAIAPICGIYYPLSVLPEWILPVALLLPASHVFEGMRAVLVDGTFAMDHFVNAVALNAVYITGGILVFLRAFQVARQRGLLLNIGE